MLLKLVLFYIPATFVAHYGVLRVLKVDFEYKNLAIYAVILGLLTMLLRDILNMTGMHVLVLSAFSIFMLMYFFKLSITKSVTVRAFLLLVLTIGEAATSQYFFNWTGITLEQVFSNPYYHILLGWLGHIIPLAMVGYLLIQDLIVVRERGNVLD